MARQGFVLVARQAEDEKKGLLAGIFKRTSLQVKAENYLIKISLEQERLKKEAKRGEEQKWEAVKRRARAEAERKKKEKELKKKGEEKKRKEEEKIKKEEQKARRKEELQLFFQTALDYYNKSELEQAIGLLRDLLKELAIEKQQASLVDKVSFILPLSRKSRGFLREVQRTQREEELRRRQARKLREAEEAAQKQKITVEKPPTKEKDKEQLVKKYQAELAEQKKKLTEKYEAELARQQKELQDKMKDFKSEEESKWEEEQELAELLKKERMRRQLEKEMTDREAEIKKKYEQELEQARKAVQEQQARELGKVLIQTEITEQREVKEPREIIREVRESDKARESEGIKELRESVKSKASEEAKEPREIIREAREPDEIEEVREVKRKRKALEKEEQELRSREVEIIRMREAPLPETLPEKEKEKWQEQVLMEEKELQERRKLIEEEVKKLEEAERKKLETPAEAETAETAGLAGGEEFEAERTKRRLWLKKAIEEETEILKRKESEKSRKEKEAVFKDHFNQALFYYKEHNLDKALQIFRELKKILPEPEKEPGFFARLLGRIPLYIQAENHISKIKKQRLAEEERIAGIIRERAKALSGEKEQKKPSRRDSLKKIAHKFSWVNPLILFRKIFYFPPMAAIDISDYSIEILRLNKKRAILGYGRAIIKEGVVKEGEIKNQKELFEAFNLVVHQAGFPLFKPKKGPILRGIISLPEYKTNVQVFTFKSKENIFEKTREEIKKTIPFSLDELYWDYLESWDEKSKQTKVLAVAVLREIIHEQVHFLKSCGVEPMVFDIEAASVGRALLSEVLPERKVGRGKEKKYFQKIDKDTMIIDIGAPLANLSIFDREGFVNLSTTTPRAGHYLRDEVSRYFKVSPQEAETIIQLKGFRKQDNFILATLEKAMEGILKEVERAIRHYQARSGQTVKKIILAGGTALLPETDKFFQSRFPDMEVKIGNPLKGIKRKGGIDESRAVLYANSIGLALRSAMKDPAAGINLLPEKIKAREKQLYWQRHRLKKIVIIVILFVLILVAALLSYLRISGRT